MTPIKLTLSSLISQRGFLKMRLDEHILSSIGKQVAPHIDVLCITGAVGTLYVNKSTIFKFVEIAQMPKDTETADMALLLVKTQDTGHASISVMYGLVRLANLVAFAEEQDFYEAPSNRFDLEDS